MSFLHPFVQAAWADEARDEPARFLLETALSSIVLTLLGLALSVAMPELFRAVDTRIEVEIWAGCTAIATLACVARAIAARRFGPTAIVATIAVLVLLPVVREVVRPTWDFDSYYRAGEQLRAGRDPYGWWHLAQGGSSQGAGGRYWYSPLLASIFAVLEHLPDRHVSSPVFLAWTAICFWAACLFVVLLMTTLRRAYGWSVTAAAAFSLSVGVASTPVLRSLVLSQPNLVVVDCILGALLLAHDDRPSHRREAFAGALFAVACLLKTSPIVMLVLLAFHRRFRLLAWALASGAIAVALSALAYGLHPWVVFPLVASSVRSDGWYRDNSFESLFLASLRLAGSDSRDLAHWAGLAVSIAVVVALLLAGRSRDYEWPWTSSSKLSKLARDLPVALVAMTLLSPVVWEHHWGWLALPCALVLPGGRPRVYVAAALVFFVPTFDAFPFAYHRLAGTLLVVDELRRSSRTGSRRS